MYTCINGIVKLRNHRTHSNITVDVKLFTTVYPGLGDDECVVRQYRKTTKLNCTRVQLFVKIYRLITNSDAHSHRRRLRHHFFLKNSVQVEWVTQQQMDLGVHDIFGKCVDQIALGGRDGMSFSDAIHTVVGPQVDTPIVQWIIREFQKRSPKLFISPDFNAPVDTLKITACQSLRFRALGYDVIEHGTIQDTSLRMLEVIGKAGPNGILQSDLGPILKKTAVMVHHYLGSLLARELVAKKKVVLTRKKQKKKKSEHPYESKSKSSKKNKNKKNNKARNDDDDDDDDSDLNDSDSDNDNSENENNNNDLNDIQSTQQEQKPNSGERLRTSDFHQSISVTYTAVLVLSRFEAFITNTNLTKTFRSIQANEPVPAPGAPAAFAQHLPIEPEASMSKLENEKQKDASSVAIIDLTGDERLHRVVEILRKQNVRAERDLKVICMPDSNKPSDVSIEIFRRKRHRAYRTIRGRLIRLGLAKIVRRNCVSIHKRTLGKQPCLTLTKLGKSENAIEDAFRRKSQSGGTSTNNENNMQHHNHSQNEKKIVENRIKASTQLPRGLVPIFENYEGPCTFWEVDLVQQVYELMLKVGAQGISVPEIDAYFDGGTGLTGFQQKRIRNLLKAIARKEPMMECQLFEGKIMYVRFALAKFVDKENPNYQKSFPEIENPAIRRYPSQHKSHKRRKLGITTLGERRQEIILKILEERKAIIMETMGREVATVEGMGLVRVDQKVMRRITNDLLQKKKMKIITASKPSIKESRRWQTIRIAALPHIEEQSIEVRNVVNSVVDKALYGNRDEDKEGTKVKKEEDIIDDEDEADWELGGKSNRKGTQTRSSNGSTNRNDMKSPSEKSATEMEDDSDDENEDEVVVVENPLDRQKLLKPETSTESKKRRQSESGKKGKSFVKTVRFNLELPEPTESELQSASGLAQTPTTSSKEGQQCPFSSLDSNEQDRKIPCPQTSDNNKENEQVTQHVPSILEADDIHPVYLDPTKDHDESINGERVASTVVPPLNLPIVNVQAEGMSEINKNAPVQNLVEGKGSAGEPAENEATGAIIQAVISTVVQNSTSTEHNDIKEAAVIDNQTTDSATENESTLKVQTSSDQVTKVAKSENDGTKVDDKKPKKPGEPICVQSKARDPRQARIDRLRAIDYGWMKGAMARVRLFHKLLFKFAYEKEQQKLEKVGDFTSASQPSTDTETPTTHPLLDFTNGREVEYLSIPHCNKLPCLSDMKIFSCFKEMTVGEYAATVGMSMEHDVDLLDSIKEERIEDVVEIIRPEITSQHACRRIKSLVQSLTRLGLIQPTGKSNWALSGAGIIRDFGKGMPPGVSPHAIALKNQKALDIYWRELRRFSSFRLSKPKKQISKNSGEKDLPLNEHVDSSTPQSGQSKRNQTRERNQMKDERGWWKLREVYQPVSWETGLIQDLSLYDQLLFECVIQRLCGVDISGEKLNLFEAPIVSEPLRHFSVEELIDELDRVGSVNEYVGKRQRYATVSEGLLRYARLRSRARIPEKLSQHSESFGASMNTLATAASVNKQTAKVKPRRRVSKRKRSGCRENVKKPALIYQKSSVLRVSKKGLELDAEEVVRPISTSGPTPNFQNSMQNGRDEGKKTLMKRKLNVTDAETVKIGVHDLLDVLREILESGSVAYCCEDVELSDWRKVASSVLDQKIEMVVPKEFQLTQPPLTNDSPSDKINKNVDETEKSDLGGESQGKKEARFRAITGICHSMFLRSSFDVLSLKAVLEIRRQVTHTGEETNKTNEVGKAGEVSQSGESSKPNDASDPGETGEDSNEEGKIIPRTKIENLSKGIINGWKNLNEVLIAIVKMVSVEVLVEWRVMIEGFEEYNSLNHRERLIDLIMDLRMDTDKSQWSNQTDETIREMMHIMSSRFKRVANLQLKRNVTLGVLLQAPKPADERDHDGKKITFTPSQSGKSDNETETRTGLNVSNENGENNNNNEDQENIEDAGNIGDVEKSDKNEKKREASSDGGGADGINTATPKKKRKTGKTVVIKRKHNGMRIKRRPKNIPKSDEDHENIQNYEGPARIALELAEIIVSVILRQNPFEQWSDYSKEMLSKLDEETIALARDRHIMRGSVIMAHDYDERLRHLGVNRAKIEKAHDTLGLLAHKDVPQREEIWKKDLNAKMKEHNGSVELTATQFCKDLFDLEDDSISGSVMYSLTKMTLFNDNHGMKLNLDPVFVEYDNPNEYEIENEEDHGFNSGKRCVLKLGGLKNGQQNDINPADAMDVDELTDDDVDMELVDWISTYVGSFKWNGVELTKLVNALSSEGKIHEDTWNDDSLRIMECLRWMIHNEKIQRFAVMSCGKEWTINDGVLLVDEAYCRGMRSSDGSWWISAWCVVGNGGGKQVDTDLVREIGNIVLEQVMKKPGVGVLEMTNYIGTRYAWLPRRCIADLIFGLIRRGILNTDIIEWCSEKKRWGDVSFGSDTGFTRKLRKITSSIPGRPRRERRTTVDMVEALDIDSLAILFWKKRVKVYIKVVPKAIGGGAMWMGSDDEVVATVRHVI